MAISVRKRQATTRQAAHPGATATTPVAADRSLAAVWWRSYRHHLRLLRNGAIAWIAALAGIGAGVAATFEDRHGTPEELAALEQMVGIPAFEALVGRYVEPATVEGLTLSRWGLFGILAAVWGMLAAARLFRGAEETGHLEPLRAGAIGPRALLGSALAALFTTHLLFAVAIGLGHTVAGMDAATSWALGGAIALLTASFAAGAALVSQLAGSRRRVAGIMGIALGVALGIRVVAAASGTPEWVWWTTPFGWTGYLHEIDQARGRVFLAFGLLLAALVVAALATARRDLHAGLLGRGEQETVRRAVRPVSGQAALARRLVAGSVRTWGFVVATIAVVFGLLTRDFADAVAELPTTVELVARLGWVGIDTAEGIIGWTFAIVALVLAVFAAGQVAAIREEEATWRIEHLLVRPLGRVRWLVTRVLTAAAAVVVIALAGGLAAWVGTAVVGSPIRLGDALLAGINVAPAALLALGVGVALIGFLPRVAVSLTYGLVVGAYVLDFVGGLLQLPEWVLNLSPFRHLTAVPAADLNVRAALVMLAIAVAAAVVGVFAFRRRDLQEA
jgi:ABC-2 type transport system permease protein